MGILKLVDWFGHYGKHANGRKIAGLWLLLSKLMLTVFIADTWNLCSIFSIAWGSLNRYFRHNCCSLWAIGNVRWIPLILCGMSNSSFLSIGHVLCPSLSKPDNSGLLINSHEFSAPSSMVEKCLISFIILSETLAPYFPWPLGVSIYACGRECPVKFSPLFSLSSFNLFFFPSSVLFLLLLAAIAC